MSMTLSLITTVMVFHAATGIKIGDAPNGPGVLPFLFVFVCCSLWDAFTIYTRVKK